MEIVLNTFKENKNYNLNSILLISALILNEKLKNYYPQIEILMKIYLAIHATSVAAECVFSFKTNKTLAQKFNGTRRLLDYAIYLLLSQTFQ